MSKSNTTCLENAANATEFLLLGFQVLPELKPFLFLIFLSAYTFTVAGNVLIIVTVSTNNRLHSPMYLFLRNLSLLDIFYSTNIVPTMLGGLLTRGIIVSFMACFVQLYMFGCLMCTECFLLTFMAYDRYVAICYPLHYNTLMDCRLCLKLSISAWAASFTSSSVLIILLCKLQFFGHYDIDHFFCDLKPILSVTCSDTYQVEMHVFSLSFFTFSLPLLLIVVSYLYIISAILRIPSNTGRRSAFSTCSAHLSVVIMFFGTLITQYVVPPNRHSVNINKALSVMCTVLIPLLNPIIYTLRNKDIREAMKILFSKSLQLSF